VQAHFHRDGVSPVGGKQGSWKSDVMRMPALGMLRGVERVMMQIPGMYGVRSVILYFHRYILSLIDRVSNSGGKTII
jgi:hypothetical protein